MTMGDDITRKEMCNHCIAHNDQLFVSIMILDKQELYLGTIYSKHVM